MPKASNVEDRTTIEITGSDGKKSGPVPFDQFTRAMDVAADVLALQKLGKAPNEAAPSFALEPDVHPGTVPARVVDELREGYRLAKDRSQSYNDAAKAQAEKYKIKPGALKRYIAALENDSLEDVERENDDLARLIGARDEG